MFLGAHLPSLILQLCHALQEFEKKSNRIKARAATNLAFLFCLEGEIDQADKYSELALKSDRYNARAYVNKVRHEEHRPLDGFKIPATSFRIQSV